ncbi:FG-GAP-like repeat-containing protein [Streptomyces crystallinus]|uniref:SGNH hydrolase-type esterase domain-containing protein n=1 Tax=Streptomyces crystallinus TaxID=68191 RepID=A0ABP3Q6R4_9ACTN
MRRIRSTRCLLALAGALCLATLPASPSAADHRGTPVLRVMPLGDSITWGGGSPTLSSYRRPLSQIMRLESRYTVRFVGSKASGSFADFSNEGHSGYVIDQLTAGIDGWMAGARPDVVLLHIGINDIARGIDLPHAPDRLAALVDRIYADKPDVSVLVMGLIPTTSGLEEPAEAFNVRARELEETETEAGHKFRYVEPPALTQAEFVDQLHPNDAGFRRMAWSFFKPLDAVWREGWESGGPALGAGTEAGGANAVRWADLDGDRRMDQFTLDGHGGVSVRVNRGGAGHGGWQPTGRILGGLPADPARVRFADFDGDGRADCLTLDTGGAVSVRLYRGGDDHGGWQLLGHVTEGTTADAGQVVFTDFDGDGRTDYVTLGSTGEVRVRLNRGGDGRGGWTDWGRVATGVTAEASRVRFADLDDDGRPDYSVVAADGSVRSFLNRGGDTRGGWVDLGTTTTGLTDEADRVSLADFSGDGNADYILAGPTAAAASVRAWAGGDGHGGWVDRGRVISVAPRP